MITLVTPEEHAAHHALAEEVGVTLSELVRLLLLRERRRVTRAAKRAPRKRARKRGVKRASKAAG